MDPAIYVVISRIIRHTGVLSPYLGSFLYLILLFEGEREFSMAISVLLAVLKFKNWTFLRKKITTVQIPKKLIFVKSDTV